MKFIKSSEYETEERRTAEFERLQASGFSLKRILRFPIPPVEAGVVGLGMSYTVPGAYESPEDEALAKAANDFEEMLTQEYGATNVRSVTPPAAVAEQQGLEPAADLLAYMVRIEQ